MYLLSLVAFSVNYAMQKKDESEGMPPDVYVFQFRNACVIFFITAQSHFTFSININRGARRASMPSTGRFVRVSLPEEPTRIKRIFSHRKSSAGSFKFPDNIGE